MKIFIVNGAPGSGKTTFETLARDQLGNDNCFILSTVDYVKEVAKFCGWKGTKSLKDRKFLSDLKDALSAWNNSPNEKIIQQIENISLCAPDSVIFIDCREPDEIEKLCTILSAKSVLIKRTSVEELVTSNHADEEVLNYAYDYIIDNNGSLNQLKESVKTLLSV